MGRCSFRKRDGKSSTKLPEMARSFKLRHFVRGLKKPKANSEQVNLLLASLEAEYGSAIPVDKASKLLGELDETE